MITFKARVFWCALVVGTASAPAFGVSLTEALRLRAVELLPGVASSNLNGTSIFDDTAAASMLSLKRAALDKIFARIKTEMKGRPPAEVQQRMATEVSTMLLGQLLRGVNLERIERRKFYDRFEAPDGPALVEALKEKIMSVLSIDPSHLHDFRQVARLNEHTRTIGIAGSIVGRLAPTPLMTAIRTALLDVGLNLKVVAAELESKSEEAERRDHPSVVDASSVDDDQIAADVLHLGIDEWREVLKTLATERTENKRQTKIGEELGRRLIALVLSPDTFRPRVDRVWFYGKFDRAPNEVLTAMHATAIESLGAPVGEAAEKTVTADRFDTLVRALERLQTFERSPLQWAADHTLTTILYALSPRSVSAAAEPPADPKARPSVLAQKIDDERESFRRRVDYLIVDRVLALDDAFLNEIILSLVEKDLIRVTLPWSQRSKLMRTLRGTPKPSPASVRSEALDVDRIMDAEWEKSDGQTSERTRLRLNTVRNLIEAQIMTECERRMTEVTANEAARTAKLAARAASAAAKLTQKK